MLSTPPDVAALIARTQALMAEHRVPGVALGLLVDGETYTTGLGVTSVENPLPVNGDTLFQLSLIHI